MINIGIIGAGRIGQVHAKSILTGVPEAKIKAIADPFMTEQTEQWAKSVGINNVYLDHKKIIDDPEIDAVLICSSTDTHCPISLEAIAAGKHVFCEKPIDHDLEKIKSVISALEGKNIKYQVGFNRRFDHNFRAVRDAVVKGSVGDIQVIKISSRDPAPPPIAYVKISGGIYLDMMIHDFDMVRFLSGSEVDEVTAYGAALVDPAIGEAGDVDTAIVTMKLKNGALAVIDNSRQAVYGYDQRAEVFGSKGCVECGNDRASTAVISTVDGVNSEKPLWFFLERYMAAYQLEIRSFIDAIVNDTPTEVGVDDGLQPVLIGLAAKKSMEEGRPVKISEISI
ncbi:inositol 2-dehydrogenase [Eubacteriales bacterium OttesenSCG-928-K08]|nr:inositol 2-dehydrogenase [Eubacteriales bacterium OttesenSCG-928-K08]